MFEYTFYKYRFLKVPPFVLVFIPNNSENVSDVYEIHNQVLAYFKIHILSIG